jgi:hypothetical protein
MLKAALIQLIEFALLLEDISHIWESISLFLMEAQYSLQEDSILGKSNSFTFKNCLRQMFKYVTQRMLSLEIQQRST